jgi:NAD(P)-dependent dehydrogenase (short-subunit alcohol dehydrogenase family)
VSAGVAVVTGASRGIGRRLVEDLADRGFDVVCVARSSRAHPSRLPGTVEDAAEAVEKRGQKSWAVAMDVRDEAEVAALATRVYEEWGRCDLLVNNAAIAPPLPALEESPKRWRLAVDVNLNAPFWFMYHLCPRMDGGRVINVSSVAAVMPSFGRASYTTTKRALEALTESLAHDLRGRVAVNCLRIDIPVYSEGFEATMPPDWSGYEDAVVVSDAVLWLLDQPLAWSGRIESITGLRERGVVRPKTPHRKP